MIYFSIWYEIMFYTEVLTQKDEFWMDSAKNIYFLHKKYNFKLTKNLWSLNTGQYTWWDSYGCWKKIFLLLFYLKFFIFSPQWNLQETFLLHHLLNLQLLTLQLLEQLWSKQPYTHIWWPKMSVWSKIYNSEQNYFSSFEKASSWMLYFKKEEEGIDLFSHLVAPK